MLDEIELYGELVIAASASEQPLSRDEIDRVLGLEHRARATSASPADGCPARGRRVRGSGPGLPGSRSVALASSRTLISRPCT